jgi:hypothetical protein
LEYNESLLTVDNASSNNFFSPTASLSDSRTKINAFFHYRPDTLFTDEEIENAKDVKVFKGKCNEKEGTVIELI